MKMGNEQIVRAHAQNALLRSHLRRASKYPVVIDITWYEKDARRDFDNITFAQKFILDSLVQIKVLKDDSRKFVKKVKSSHRGRNQGGIIWQIKLKQGISQWICGEQI